MQIYVRRRLRIDPSEKLQKFMVPMTWHSFADQSAFRHIQRGELRRRAVTFVVVRHRSAAAFLQRQARLRAIQRLKLALFVNAQHQDLLRGPR